MRALISIVFSLLLSTPLLGQGTNAIDSLKARIANEKPDSIKVNLLDDLCWEYLYSDPQQAIPYATEAIRLAQTIGFKKGESRLWNTLGVAYVNQGKYLEARGNYQRALTIKKQINDIYGQASCLQNIGNVFLYLASYDSAITYYLKSLSILEQLGRQSEIGVAYNNLASAYEYLEDYENVFRYASKSLAIAESLGNDAQVMSAKISIGNVYDSRKQYEKALVYFEEAMVLAVRMHDTFGMAMCHHNIASVYKDLGKPQEALTHYRSQLQLANLIDSNNDRMFASLGIGKIYRTLKDYNLSLRFLSEALKLSRELGTRYETKEIYEELSLLHEDMKSFGKALEFHKRYTQLNDSLYNEAKSRQINTLNIAYETARKENEISKLNEDNLLQASELTRQRTVRNLLIGGFTLIFGLSVLLYRSSAQRKKDNELLQWQKIELEKSDAIKTKLFSVISHDLRSPITSLHGLMQIIEEKFRDAELKPFIDHANVTTGQAINLLDNLLYWSANQMKGLTLHMTNVSLVTVVDENKSLFAPLFRAKQINFSNTIGEHDLVYADTTCIQFVLRNLISNAIKFTPMGGTITVSAERKDRIIETCVSDTGIGIAPSVFEKLFTYESPSTKGTGNEKGAGLGLLMCKDFIERHEGRIWAECDAIAGTHFRFTLPAYESPEDPSAKRRTNFLSTIL